MPDFNSVAGRDKGEHGCRASGDEPKGAYCGNYSGRGVWCVWDHLAFPLCQRCTRVYAPIILCRFLLVSLKANAIQEEVAIRRGVRKKLEEKIQSHKLSEAYTATHRRLKPRGG